MNFKCDNASCDNLGKGECMFGLTDDLIKAVKSGEKVCKHLKNEVLNYLNGSERMTLNDAKENFKKEIQSLIKQKCDEINHYVSGCDSPFTYMQIADVQGDLVGILYTLGIKTGGVE